MNSEVETTPFATLTGNWPVTVDEKSRLTLPAGLRRVIESSGHDGERFIMVRPLSKSKVTYRFASLYTEKRWDWMLRTKLATSSILPTEAREKFIRYFVATSKDLEWDKAGRVLISEKTLTEFGLGKNLVLVGCMDHVEIWNAADWEADQAQLVGERDAILALSGF